MVKNKKVQIWGKYDVEGDQIKRKGKSCPRCGDGIFLAEHENRNTCGRCGFSQIKSDK